MEREYLEMRGIVKNYGGIKALDDVSLILRKGELLCLLGENGAGKSTLMKILSGVEHPTAGEIYLKGEKIELKDPKVAHAYGISTVYQELVQLPDMSIAENIFAGRYPMKGMFVDFARLKQMTLELMDKLNIHFDPDIRIRSLSIAQRQLVEIVKAVSQGAEILILDEPTSSLTAEETAILFRIIDDLKKQGVSIIYISHRLEDVFAIGDRAVILKDGKNSGEGMVRDLDRDTIIRMMVGHALEQQFPKRERCVADEVVLKAEHIKNERAKDCSFELRRGEILGFGGLVGAGRSELMRAIVGVDPSEGEVYLEGQKIDNKSPAETIAKGIIMVPESRKDDGLVLGLSIGKNIELSSLKELSTGLGFMDAEKENAKIEEYVKSLSIKTWGAKQIVGDLSGGNQQKVVISRCLSTNPKVMILDEPTRGIDVGAKYEIYVTMNELAAQGVSIIMVSSELPELLAMSDRLIVMREGVITGEISHEEANEENVMDLATKEVVAR